MRPSQKLFELVKSLTPSEKRHFRLYSQRHVIGEENNYMLLFDAIEQQKAYDEDAIRKKFYNRKFIKQLHVSKNHLYTYILKSLNEFRNTDSLDFQLREMLSNAETLFAKGLYDHASVNLIKLKKQAYRYEKFMYVMHVIEWENKIAFARLDIDSVRRVIEQGAIEEVKLMEQYRIEREYRRISDKLKIFIKTKGVVNREEEIAELNNIIQSPLLSNEQNTISYSTKISFLHIFSKYFMAKEDYKMAYPYCQKLVFLIESDVGNLKRNPGAYLAGLNNLLITLMELRKFDEFATTLEMLKSLESKNEDFQAKSFSYRFIHEWNLYFYSGRISRCIELIPLLEQGLQQFEKQIAQDLKLRFYFNVFYGYFVVEDYKNALKWLNKILNDKRTEIRQDIRSFSLIVNLIVEYEMGAFDLLDYSLRSAQRWFKGRKEKYEFEPFVIKSMRQLLGCGQDQDAKKSIFIRLRNKLLFTNLKQYLVAVSQGSSEKIIFNIFDINSWLESKIENRPFAEVLIEVERDKQVRDNKENSEFVLHLDDE